NSSEHTDLAETPGDETEAVFPTRTAVPTDELKFISWPEWSLFEFRDLDITNVLLMSYGAANSTSKAHTAKQVRIGNLYAPRWFDAAGRISDAQGVDGNPLYTTSPKLALPQHDGAEWTVELYYTDTTAEAYSYEELPERELVEEKIELDQHEGKPFPLFDDVFEDAWIGHYDIDVLRNGELVERRTYNMAEGFNLRVSYTGDSGAHFRHPDQTVMRMPTLRHILPLASRLKSTSTFPLNAPNPSTETSAPPPLSSPTQLTITWMSSWCLKHWLILSTNV